MQVYAACGYSNNGSIRVIQADQTVETLYESGADYPGISGMWSLPPWPGAEFHSLLVLSFASGSRAMATGSFWQCQPSDLMFNDCSVFSSLLSSLCSLASSLASCCFGTWLCASGHPWCGCTQP